MAAQEENSEAGLKSAVLLIMALDKPVLAQVLKHLPPHQLSTLVQAYEQVARNETPAETELLEVGRKFLEAGPGGSATHFQDALALAFGDESADQIMHQERWSMIPDRIKPEALGAVLRGERPEAVAIALAQLPSRYSADVLATLPGALRAASVDHLARSGSVSGAALDAILSAIEESFSVKVRFDGGDPEAGTRRAAAILNQLDSESAAAIVEQIRARDAERASAVEQEMFHFHDFLKLDGRSLQRILAEIKPERLALALKGTAESERATVWESLPEQIRLIVSQEIEDSGAVPMRDVRAARREITDMALQMDREGKIRVRMDQDLVS